ncbi:hypothetical protein TrVE_jg13910 [Triparma verrucosa]|uniref:Uncharacterized protein n=1 Tax=Triparma verrucosa TaxID=1606542 RepID=A0A9W7AYY0_9STRA|nr:hypothetical protein TrVE_jg13910 [Triparma verrucosa]
MIIAEQWSCILQEALGDFNSELEIHKFNRDETECDGNFFGLMPLTFVVAGAASIKILITGEDFNLTKMSTLNMKAGELLQFLLTGLLTTFAIVKYGMRQKGPPTTSDRTQYYVFLFCTITVIFIQFLYSGEGHRMERGDGDGEADSISLEMRKRGDGSNVRKSLWDGGSKGLVKPLPRDRSIRVLQNKKSNSESESSKQGGEAGVVSIGFL